MSPSSFKKTSCPSSLSHVLSSSFFPSVAVCVAGTTGKGVGMRRVVRCGRTIAVSKSIFLRRILCTALTVPVTSQYL